MVKLELKDDKRVVVCNVSGRFRAVDGTCSHAEVDLSTGWLNGKELACPAHGSAFDVETGEAMSPPASEPLATYRAFVENGWVHVELPEG